MSRSLEPKPPYRHVIVATDGSALSGAALTGGARLAAQIKADLHVFHAALSAASQKAAVDSARELLQDQPFTLEVVDLNPDSPADAISAYAARVGDCVVCLGTHGRGGIRSALIGSTALDLVGKAGHTLLAFGPKAAPATRTDKVIACVDGTEFSEASVTEGVRWASALGVPLWLVQVIPPGLPQYVSAFESTYVYNLAQDLAGSDVTLEWEVLHSLTPARALLEMFGEDGETMMVLATHGRRGLPKVMLGSVATEVVRSTWGPVVLVAQSAQPGD